MGGKVFFLVWAVAIPLALHPPLHVAEVFLLASAVASLSLTVTFQLSHCLEEASHARRRATAPAGAEWHIHQVEATADFARETRSSAGTWAA